MFKTTIADAMKSPVRIALQNGKSFKAAVLDVVDGGDGLHVVRLPSMRKEILRFGFNFGDINSVAPIQFRDIIRNIREESFDAFKESQARYFKEREEQRKTLSSKIKKFDAAQKVSKRNSVITPRVENRTFDPLKFEYIQPVGSLV